MKLNDDVYVLALAREPGNQANPFNLSLILDQTGGPTLVDTGLPDQADAIDAALAEAGLHTSDLRQIIVTHQDIDHVGSLHDLVQVSGAKVYAYADEVATIDGTTPPRFATPEALELHPHLRGVADRFQPTLVDQALHDDTRLGLAGGVQVIATPGHTPGHICLYLERSRTLIAGDALTAEDGQLRGPNAGATQDMAQATRSVQRLAELDVQQIVCYHGGVVGDDANGQLRRVAEELAAAQPDA